MRRGSISSSFVAILVKTHIAPKLIQQLDAFPDQVLGTSRCSHWLPVIYASLVDWEGHARRAPFGDFDVALSMLLNAAYGSKPICSTIGVTMSEPW